MYTRLRNVKLKKIIIIINILLINNFYFDIVFRSTGFSLTQKYIRRSKFYAKRIVVL